MILRQLLLAFAVLASTVLGVTAVGAHSGIQSYVYVSLFDTRVEGRVEYPIGDIAAALDIELPEDRDQAFESVRRQSAEVIAYTDTNLSMADADGHWPIRFSGQIDRLDLDQGDYVLVPFVIDRNFADTPRSWSTTFSGVIEDNPERDALFLIEDDWASGVFDNEGNHLLSFSVGNETQRIDLETVSTVRSMWEIATRGWRNIDSAQIQVVVLLAVLLAAVVRRADRAWPGDLRRIATRVGAVITGQLVMLIALGVVGAQLTTRLGLAVACMGGLAALASSRVSDRAALVVCGSAGVVTGVVLGSRFVLVQLDQSRTLLSLIAFALGAVVAAVCLAALFTPFALLLGRLSRAGVVADTVAVLAVAIGALGVLDRLFSLGLEFEKWGVTLANTLTNPIFAACATAVVAWVALRDVSTSENADASRRPDTDRIEI